ncbi:MAG TPA: hypothetical protein VNZ64_11780 [Candidatus Acidoferrum sp.]|jgi:hypothetical protein|nr:hypothetical protein [Candidatus Acidoferrum sp.]
MKTIGLYWELAKLRILLMVLVTTSLGFFPGARGSASAPPLFHYFDKGSKAVVGKGFAILHSGKFRLSG